MHPAPPLRPNSAPPAAPQQELEQMRLGIKTAEWPRGECARGRARAPVHACVREL